MRPLHLLRCAVIVGTLGFAPACHVGVPSPPVGALPADSGFVTADDGIRLFYRALGDGALDVVIPVAFYLEEALRPLAAPDRRLVFYDPRGRGRSEAGDRSLVTLDRQIADLETVRRALGIEAMVLLGWSGLGMETFVYALRHPDRVRGLVQVAPVAARDEPHNARAYETRRERMDTAAVRAVRERHGRGDFVGDPAGYCRAVQDVTMPVNLADPAHMARLPDPCVYPTEHPDSLGPLFSALLASFAGYDWRDAAADLPVRRLVIHGADDPFPLDGSREWVPPGSNARLLVIDEAGHFPFLERPEAFFPAVDAFLRGEWPAGPRVRADRAGPERLAGGDGGAPGQGEVNPDVICTKSRGGD